MQLVVRLVSLVCVILQFCVFKTASFPTLNCRNCAGSCTFGSAFEQCRCDGDCVLYGDCCADRNATCPTSVGATELEARNYNYECRLLIADEDVDKRYVWMVSTCPDGFAQMGPSEDLTVQNCISDSASLALPVTDRNTGAVFKNEYCAACNGVTDYVSWSYQLLCLDVFQEVITNNSGVITQEDLNEYCSFGMYLPPTGLAVADARDCYPVLDTCPINELPGLDLENTTGLAYQAIVEMCASGPQNLAGTGRFSLPPAYRNLYCALCDGVPADRVNCFLPLRLGGGPGGIPYTLFLDVNGGGLIATSADVTTTVSVSCTGGQVYDITSDQCRDTIVCFNGVEGTDCSSECNESLIELNETDSFRYAGDGSVFFANQVLEVEFNTSRGFPVVCINFTENGTELVNMTITIYSYPEAYFILTYIGCSLSVIACVLLLVTYGLFKELRTLPSRIVMNLAVAIIIGNLLILLGGPVAAAFLTIQLCASVAILLHYFFLSQFSWMSIISFEMARTFYRAYKLQTAESKGFKRNLLVAYVSIGWGTPLIITVVTIIVNSTTDGLVLYGIQEDGTLGSCWINHLKSSVVAFIAPLAMALLFNFATFVITLVFICVAARSKAKFSKDKNIPYIRLTLAVFSISGLTWLFGLLAIFSSAAWTWYPFIVFNSLQGLFIFLVFLATKRVIMLYRNALCCMRGTRVMDPDLKKRNDGTTKQSDVNVELDQSSFYAAATSHTELHVDS